MITVSKEAAEEIKRLLTKQEKPEGWGLRVGVKGGGCSGLSYTLDMGQKQEEDNLTEAGGVKVFVDPKSYLYLNGMMLDFQDGLQGRGFKFINPNAKRTCGCGESFST